MMPRRCSSPPSAPSPPTSPFPSTSLVTGPLGMLLAIVVRLEGPAVRLRARRRAARAARCAASGTASPAREHIPLDRAAVYCSNHQSNVDPPVLFDALHPRMHILYKHEIDQIPVLARAFRHGRLHSRSIARNKEAAMRSIEAGAASIRAGQLVPDLSRGHAQPDRRAAAVQEGRLHHGHQGAGRRSCRSPSRAAAPRCSGAARSSGRSTVSIRVGEPDRDGRPRRLDDRDDAAS